MSSDEEPASGSTQKTHPFDRVLYPVAAADLTVFATYLLIFQYSVRHSLTKRALQKLLQLLSVLLPSGSALPKSVNALKSFFVQRFPDQKPLIRNYCSNCHQLLTQTEECCASKHQFLTVPLGPQLEVRLEGQHPVHKKIFRCISSSDI